MSYQRGDGVWGPDPFEATEAPRPRLLLNNDRHPFGDEEYMTVTLTTTPHDATVPIEADDRVEGGMPRQSYASPWSIASPKRDVIVRRQGRLRESFVQTVIESMQTYLDPPTDAV